MSSKEPKWYDKKTTVLVSCTTQVRCGHCGAKGGAAHAAQCTGGGRDHRKAVEAALKIHTDAGGAKSDFVPPPMETTGAYSAKEIQLIQALQATAFKTGLQQVMENRRKTAQKKKEVEENRRKTAQKKKEDEAESKKKKAQDLQNTQDEENKKMKPTPAMQATFPQMPWPYQFAMNPGYGGMGYAGPSHPYQGIGLDGPPFTFYSQMFPGMAAAPVAAAPVAAAPVVAAPAAGAPEEPKPAEPAVDVGAEEQRLADEYEQAHKAYQLARENMRAGPK
jgi:hypothetical protein